MKPMGSSLRGMQGVTLIELMIVVTIVAILAAIAYPSYQNQVQSTRRSDGKAALLDAAQQLERCFTRFNVYNDDACAVDADIEDGGLLSQEEWYVVTNTNPGASTFTLVATPQGAQAADARCGTLSLTHTGVRGATGTAGAAVCW